MSGEGKSVSFKRTKRTTKSNQQLLEDFKRLVFASKKVTSHMKWRGRDHSVELIEHGDTSLPSWLQESVPNEGDFQFYISVYDSWYQDVNNYECDKTEGSFVSIAKNFAQNNNLIY